MYLIDTNVFIELLLGQKRSNIAFDVFSKLILSKKEITITIFTFHSIIVILERMKKETEIKLFCDILLSIDNFRILNPTFEEELNVIRNRDIIELDYDDSHQYYMAKKHNCCLITFDKHFDKFKEINVINLTKSKFLL